MDRCAGTTDRGRVNRTLAAQRPLADVVAVANSPDGLVEVTAGVFGDLRRLRLDPRINRAPDAAALAANILVTHRTATCRATREVSDVDDFDPAFDPVLGRIDDRSVGPRQTGPDGRPVLASYVDHTSLRRYLLRLRDELARLQARAVSGDGLITVTVTGRGGLLDLAMDNRIHRAHSAAELAGQILATAHEAAARSAGQLTAITAGWGDR